METPPANLNSVLQKVKILHLAMIGGMIVFMGMALLIRETQSPEFGVSFAAMDMLSIPISIIFFLTAILVSRTMLQNIPEEAPLEKKMERFQAAMIFRVALMEVACIIQIIFIFLIGGPLPIIRSAICIFLFFLARPNKDSRI